ncbi:aminopeptidase [Clostridium sp. D2Q-14]|uniref:aminopeptidase n=1 Tax=Anaeromonas gelatinilytica TaxID=2683194 RepID=UPI00193B585A|nr:aminopeptidase [Anaeromonas gelatinilytica]MBS4534182.1 aminopeptidase [Anaeromonas gelatinilytica]
MENFQHLLEKYAELAVKIGVNIQRDQTLVINSPIEAKEYTRALSKEAYNAGARNVIIDWNDEQSTLIKFLNAPDKAFKEYPKYLADGKTDLAKKGAAFISISASNPDLFKDVDPSRIATYNKTVSLALEKYREYMMASKVAWSVVSVPTEDWAKKVFKDLNGEEAVEKLWEKIFKITRMDKEDPIKAWREHLDNLESRVKFLNNKRFKKLHFKSEVTDLEVELPEDHLWAGGGEENEKETYFVANMPTEEVFTLPLKTGVNGVVKNTKPFNYSGSLVDNFTLTFKDGEVIDFTAEQGYETLKKLMETDEGASYLGEVALVPDDSPISNMDTIFYNTLFDENASCHLALGMAYPTCIESGGNMTNEELKEKGANNSLIHEDFMIGSPDMDIIGETKDGEKIQIFKDGNWAI